ALAPAAPRHPHAYSVAHVDDFSRRPHVVMAQLADMHQPFALCADVYEGAKVLQTLYDAGELLAFLQIAPFDGQRLDHGDHDLILLRIDSIDPDLDLVADVEHVADAIYVALAHLGD